MASAQADRFVRLSTELLEALLCSKLTGIQFRIVLWVIRNTYGWNRRSSPFTWYRIANELCLDRPAVYRAGKALLQAEVLVLQADGLAVQVDHGLWDRHVLSARTGDGRQLWMPGFSVAREQRPALSENNGPVAGGQHQRCQPTTVFRRAKDSSKERSKTYKDIEPCKSVAQRQRFYHRVEEQERYCQPSLMKSNGKAEAESFSAGAATPIPRKYDGLSQN